MLHLHYSNRFEALAERLADDVAAHRGDAAAALLEPVPVVVPNQHVAAYLKLVIARRTGVAAGLSFPFVESFLARRVAGDGARLLERESLHALLIAVLEDRTLLAEPDMAPVAAYLRAGDGDDDAFDLRRVQLAGEVASLLVEYGVSRPELLSAWRRGPALANTEAADIERWQRRLYLAALERSSDRLPVVGLAELFERAAPAPLDLPPHVYAIGFSYLARAYRQIFGRLAEACELHVYALNPCMEYWEDLRSGWEQRLRGRRLARRESAGEPPELEADTPALRLWGLPGRESTRLLNELTGCDFQPAFADPTDERDTVLANLQRDILFREPERDQPICGAGDDSIRILACPDIARELEIIGNEIWAMIRADDTLRFNDVAVLVARGDLELYQAQVASVFSELGVPHHVIDLPLVSESRLVEAFELLLDLPLGRFTRPELLRVLTHPAVLARYPDVDPDDWVHWSERLGIVHGADRADHAGTYLDGRDIFNWDQGLKRLALGALMTGARSGVHHTVGLTGSVYAPEEVSGDEQGSAARFALLARSLIADARFCRRARMSLSRWRQLFELVVSSYLTAESEADARNLARCREAIAALSACDVDGAEVGFRVASELLRARLSGLRGSRGEFLAQGVTVAPLQPMRPLPYRVVFAAGLGEGRFPTSERESPLDLRFVEPRAGDVTPRERDRYAFLELLLSARDRLRLSYVARDDRTGEPLEPSSVVLELRQILARGYLDETGIEALTTHHPLRRYHPAYFGERTAETEVGEAPPPAVAPSARNQAAAVALRADLEAHLRERGCASPTPSQVRAALERPDLEKVRQVARLPRADGHRPTLPEPVSLSLAVLRRFLECPLQAWAQAVLGLREADEDFLTRSDEPFDDEILEKTMLLREAFTGHLRAGEDAEAMLRRYDELARQLELAGQAPVGVFGELRRLRHRDMLTCWRAHLDVVGAAGPWRTFSFGRAREHATVDELLPPIAVQIRVPEDGGERLVRVELHGRTEMVADGVGSLVLAPGKTPRLKHLLRGYIDQLALAAAGPGDGAAHGTLTVTGESAKRGRAHDRLAPIGRDEAAAELAALAAELLTGSHRYLLPYEVIEKWREGKVSDFAREVNLLKRGRGFSSSYGPVTDLEPLEAPADAEAMARRRFGPLFRRLEVVDG